MQTCPSLALHLNMEPGHNEKGSYNANGSCGTVKEQERSIAQMESPVVKNPW